MIATRVNQVIRHIHQVLAADFLVGLKDGQLLERYLEQDDQRAFAQLVRRHGPMVLSVGRRVLGNGHDADDVFQASFLVLARKAASLCQEESVAGWLFTIAHR